MENLDRSAGMTKVILDDILRARLKNLDQQLEVCDEAGRTLGHFLPAQLYQRLLYDWGNAQIDDNELQRRLNEPGGRALAEIWFDLDKS
jgi:hypothetical protein